MTTSDSSYNLCRNKWKNIYNIFAIFYYYINIISIYVKLQRIYKNHISPRNWQRRENRAKETSKSDAFRKMTLLEPPSGIWYLPTRTHKRTSDVVHTGAPPPPSISRAHVDYNYPQVITTHTTVFQWALTAVRPLYSAKLVFPFPVEENRREIARGEGTETETEKRKRLPATAGWSSIQRPPSSPLFYLV